MNNKLFGVILIVLLGVGVGICALSSISNVVQQAISPLAKEVQNANSSLDAIQSQLSGVKNNDEVLARLSAIEEKLDAIGKNSGNDNPPPAPPMPPQEDFSKVYDIDISKSYIKGKKNAPVTIVAFTDFQCPFCARFHTPIQEALKAYPDQANFVIKNFPLPFHPNAKPAAKVALAAGEQGKYFEMADALLENQNELGDEKYKELAKKIGLNVAKFEKDLKEKDAQFEAVINADMQLVNEVDVRGTPTFFINNKKTMARDAEGFKREIEKNLKEKAGK